jgi:integrase
MFFSAPHKNKFLKDGEPGTEPFGKGFFSKRFGYIRKKLKLDPSYTIYGFKHTRVIHLKIDGVPDQDIMALTGHADYVSFAHYLRDLGLTVNPDSINQKTRKL